MPGRYEMVEEPSLEGTLEEEGVYHPDQSLPPDTSIRRLEPILAGPVGLKTIFYDPRWSDRQRKTCLFLLGFSALVSFILLILLFVGLGKVLTHISWMEEMKKHGLHMQPDLEQMDLPALIYSQQQYELGNKFAFIINQTILSQYGELNGVDNQPSEVFKTCKPKTGPDPGHLCRFPYENLLQGNCKPENNFGYSNGSPCILLQFKHVGGSRKEELDANYYPPEGLDVRFFKNLQITTSSGDKYSQRLPAVMVELKGLAQKVSKGLSLEIQCRLGDEKYILKPRNFYGVKIIDFDVRSIDSPFS